MVIHLTRRVLSGNINHFDVTLGSDLYEGWERGASGHVQTAQPMVVRWFAQG